MDTAGVNNHSNSTRVRDGDNACLNIRYQESTSTADNCIKFIECLPVPSGALAGEGKLINLIDWQKDRFNHYRIVIELITIGSLSS